VYALASALANYLETSNFTWANLGGKPSLFSGSWNDLQDRPDLSVYALASALNNYLLASNFTWANLGGKPEIQPISWAKCKGTTPIEIISSDGPNAPTAFTRTGAGFYTFTRPAAASADYAWWVFGANSRIGDGNFLAKDLLFTQTETQFALACFSPSDQSEFTVFVL
jgi:hypothetical protein